MQPSYSATGKGGTVQSASSAAAGGGGGGVPDTEEEMMELQRLAERHAREREQTEVIRQNIESAISAR